MTDGIASDLDRSGVDPLPNPPEDSPGGLHLRFRPEVEGLRALAVVLVVLYHTRVRWLHGGFVGVDVFFVISGFLITTLLLDEHAQRRTISLVGFYARRARRILPAAMTVVVLTIVASYLVQNFLTYQSVATDGRWAALFVGNVRLSLDGSNYLLQDTAPSPLQHYWSLAVEEQFYVVWPAAVLLVGATARSLTMRWKILLVSVVIGVCSLIWSVHQTAQDATWAYYSPFTRAWEFAVGAMVATVAPLATRVPRWVAMIGAELGAVAIVWSAIGYTTHTAYPGYAALAPVLGTAALIAFGARSLLSGWVLTQPPVRSVGRVSYGWYLLHYPLMVILVGSLYTHPLSVWHNLEIAAGSLVVAYAMYYLIERPIRVSRWLARRPWVSLAMGAGCIGAAYAVCALLTKGV